MLMGPRGAGFSLTGLLIIVAILYFTGAGRWLWERVKTLDQSCYAMLNEMGTGRGGEICDAITAIVGKIDETFSNGVASIKNRLDTGSQQPIAQMEEYTRGVFARISGGDGSLASLTSPADQLMDMMHSNPQLVSAAASAKDRLRTALDQFVIGQQYLQQNSPGEAQEWFQQSAQQPGGYGILSQLTLGDMYRSGTYGFEKNPEAATHYYQQAGQSLALLQQSNSPQAKQLLQNLPSSPPDLSAQINQMVEQLKRR